MKNEELYWSSIFSMTQDSRVEIEYDLNVVYGEYAEDY